MMATKLWKDWWRVTIAASDLDSSTAFASQGDGDRVGFSAKPGDESVEVFFESESTASMAGATFGKSQPTKPQPKSRKRK